MRSVTFLSFAGAGGSSRLASRLAGIWPVARPPWLLATIRNAFLSSIAWNPWEPHPSDLIAANPSRRRMLCLSYLCCRIKSNVRNRSIAGAETPFHLQISSSVRRRLLLRASDEAYQPKPAQILPSHESSSRRVAIRTATIRPLTLTSRSRRSSITFIPAHG